MLREHCVSDLGDVVKLGSELDTFRNGEGHAELHNVALLAVCLLIPVFFKLVLEQFAAVFQQNVAFVAIFEYFIDSFPKQIIGYYN